MADLAYVKLTDREINERLEALKGWSISGGKLVRDFSFGTYKDGLVFAAAVGHLADRLNHHPDIAIGFAKVAVSVNTHDVGGISPYDFELARRIEVLLL